MAGKEIDALLEQLARSQDYRIIDPLTGHSPTCEIELTAAMARKQYSLGIKWSEIDVSYLRKVSDVEGSPLLPEPHLMLELQNAREVHTEYPLCARSDDNISIWGGMRADAMVVAADWRAVFLFEAKLDGYFTYGDKAPGGQLSRQLKYLEDIGRPGALILVCPDYNKDWYAKRLNHAFAHSEKVIPVALVTWEQIFELPIPRSP